MNTVNQLANLFWELNKFRHTLMCSMCVTQSVTITFSESLFQTICQRSDFIVQQSWFVFCFHLILKKTARFSVNKRKSFSIYLSSSCNLASSCAHATLETSCFANQSSSIFGVLQFLSLFPSTNNALAFLLLACISC